MVQSAAVPIGLFSSPPPPPPPLQLLFRLLVDHLADFQADPDVFSMFVEQLKKSYFNTLIKPTKLGK